MASASSHSPSSPRATKPPKITRTPLAHKVAAKHLPAALAVRAARSRGPQQQHVQVSSLRRGETQGCPACPRLPKASPTTCHSCWRPARLLTLYKCEAVDQSRSDLGTSQPPPPSGFPLGAECGLLMPNAPHASLSSSPVTNCPHSPPPSATQLRAPLLACASAHPGPLPSPAEWPTALHHSGHLTVILLGYFSGVFNAPPRELSQACRRCVMIL